MYRDREREENTLSGTHGRQSPASRDFREGSRNQRGATNTRANDDAGEAAMDTAAEAAFVVSWAASSEFGREASLIGVASSHTAAC